MLRQFSPHAIHFTDTVSSIPFDLVFLIRMRYVRKGQPLAEIIKVQHKGMDEFSNELINSIIKGKTKHRVLLMLDGYSEYTEGTNREIDTAVMSGIGNCFLIVTCQPGDYISKQIRQTMDGEFMIKGFTEESIRECSMKYLKSEEECGKMLRKAKQAGIYELLHVPEVLFMVIEIFVEEIPLPKSKTAIYETIFRLIIDRTTPRTFGCRSRDLTKLEDMLFTLGDYSWRSLQNSNQRFLLNKVRNMSLLKQI